MLTLLGTAKIRVGYSVASPDQEDDGAIGKVLATTPSGGAKVRWADGVVTWCRAEKLINRTDKMRRIIYDNYNGQEDGWAPVYEAGEKQGFTWEEILDTYEMCF